MVRNIYINQFFFIYKITNVDYKNEYHIIMNYKYRQIYILCY